MKNSITKTRSQIAEEYGITRKTLYSWCKKAKLEIPKHGALAPEHQKQIYKAFGLPNRK